MTIETTKPNDDNEIVTVKITRNTPLGQRLKETKEQRKLHETNVLTEDQIVRKRVFKEAETMYKTFRKYLLSSGFDVRTEPIFGLEDALTEDDHDRDIERSEISPLYFPVGVIYFHEQSLKSITSKSIGGILIQREKPDSDIRIRYYHPSICYHEEGKDVRSYRTPFKICLSANDTERKVGLSFEVLRGMLEPTTTRSINELRDGIRREYNIPRPGTPNINFELKALAESHCTRDEAIVALGIVRNFLYTLSRDGKITNKEVEEFNPLGHENDVLELAHLRVSMNGVGKVQKFYESNDWSAEKFLMGDF